MVKKSVLSICNLAVLFGLYVIKLVDLQFFK